MKDIPDIMDGLRRTPLILSEFVNAIPAEKLDERRGDGFWTIAEHVSRLAQVQPMLLKRFNRFFNEACPEFVPYLPGEGEDEADTPEPMHLKDALEQFARYRREQLALLEKADDLVRQRSAIHPEYETYSFYILARHLLMHDHWHMYRMEELWLTRDAYLTKME